MAIETTEFSGFRPEAIDFLADLAQNNDRAWFQPRKADYERLLKEPMEAFVAALAERFEARDIPLRADPKRSMFRIYRDTRFSKDKSPYKTNIGASFPYLASAGGAADDGARAAIAAWLKLSRPTGRTSISSPARATPVAGCGCPRSPASMPTARRSSTIQTGCAASSRTRPC